MTAITWKGLMDLIEHDDPHQIHVGEIITINGVKTNLTNSNLKELINMMKKLDHSEIYIQADDEFMVDFTGCGGARSSIFANNVIIDELGTTDTLHSRHVYDTTGAKSTGYMVKMELDQYRL